jgi:hypothetical protein
MTKTIYRSVTPKRRTSRPKAKRRTAAFAGMASRLSVASAALSIARGRR